MDDYQNPESSTPENKEPPLENNTAHDDTVPFSTEAPKRPDTQNTIPPQYTYSQHSSQPQNAYQAQNAYAMNNNQPQQPYSYNQQPNNDKPQYAYPPNYPPQYYSYNNPARGKATASLVLGIISLVFSWMSFLAVISVICSIIGIILGNNARKELPPDQGHGQATAGFVCSIIGLVLSVLMILIFTVIILSFTSYSTPFGAAYGV